MNRLLYLFTLLLSLSYFNANAQQFKKFSENQETYLEEMKALFARSETNYKKGKELLDVFEVSWLEGGFSIDEKQKVFEISNLLLKKKARNFPHFYNYLQLLLTFKEFNNNPSNYTTWETSFIALLNDKSSKLGEIGNQIIWAEHLLRDKAIYYSNTVNWYTNNNNYTILFENDTLKVRFEELNLTAILRRDSLSLLETSGVLYPSTSTWKGDKAIISWEKAGIGRDTAWAEIDSFTLDLTKSKYTIENINFYHKLYFEYPIKGTLTDKITEIRNPKSATYPQFLSNDSRFELKDIAKNIDYQGGFSMKGGRFLGTGTYYNKAKLNLYRDVELVENGDTIIKKVLFMQTHSLHYSFQNGDIVSTNAEVSLLIDNDSIYHPGLRFKYENEKHEVNLIRETSDENKAKSPYYDTYHQLEIDFEYLTWQMDESNVDISMLKGTAINIAKFESTNYFSANRYYEVQGIEEYHPYVLLRRYSRMIDSDIVHANDFAKYTGLSITPIRRLFIDLAYKGIVEYDTESEIALIQPKMYKYLDAMALKADYDLIIFESQTQAPMSNATLNLKNMDLEIRGVPMINVSDSQNVIFYPKNQEILFKRNRNFDFGGKIEAGYFTFYGDNFQFKYDSFLVSLNQVDSLSIKVKKGVDSWGQKILENVESVIEDITGELLIDDSGNKSGIKSNPEYPVFISKKESYVYYDSKDIQKGKYTRDRFYFEVDPYTIDSLNNYTTEGMGYTGRLVSSDIFPIIEQTLVLQPDNSLGFKHLTPTEGLPLYKGKGQYFATVNLSNQGLRGNGDMTYITSKTKSDNFIFYPDSTNVLTTEFTIGKKNTTVQYPNVKVGENYMHWLPYKDTLIGTTTKKPYVMYENNAKHTGDLTYTPKNLIGSGKNYYYKATLESDHINFLSNKYNADTASFLLKSQLSDTNAFNTTNVNAKVDFSTYKSTFRANNDSAKVELDENLYITYLDRFSWMMKDKKMQLETPNTVQVVEFGKTQTITREEAGLSLGGSLFISMHKGQDSLQWRSPLADFDLATNIISAHQVKYINVADARIFPDKEEVVVHPIAKLETFLDARVLANTSSKYHNFHDATINISSRKRYSGEGLYNYQDELGRLQSISFDLIAIDSLGNTFARGKILGISDFSLSPAFKYKGLVSLYATNKFLNFNGTTRISHECDEQIPESWIKFSSEINPDSIYIPIANEPRDINDNFLVSGPMIATDSISIFPSFVSPRRRYSNLPIITAQGFLHYDKKSKLYKLAESYRMHNDDTTGNILSLHKNYCTLFGEGDIDLTENLGQVKIETKGSAIYNLPEDKLNLDLLMTVDFFFPQACFKYIGDTLASMTGLKPANLKSTSYIKALKEMIGYAEADQLLKEQAIFGTVKKVPEKLNTPFVFNNLKMIWNKEQDAWQSVGEIGVANILGMQINKQIKGNIEVERKRSGDSFTLYLELSEGHWYFFNYKRGLMQAYSSESGFNTIITEIKGSARKQEIERGEQSFVFFLSNLKKRNDFLKKLKGETITEDENEFGEEGTEEQNYEQYEDFD